MKKYMLDYIKEIDEKLSSDKTDFVCLTNTHLIKIKHFQHERLIHLLVTLFFAVFDLMFFYFSFYYHLCLIILFVLTIFLVFYVIHYFRLENGVQYMYKQYDKMLEKSEKNV